MLLPSSFKVVAIVNIHLTFVVFFTIVSECCHFQRIIRRSVNQFMPFWKRVYEAPPSGVATDKEIIDKACTEYTEFHGKPFQFRNCLPILQELASFNPGTSADQTADEIVDLVEANINNDDVDDRDADGQEAGEVIETKIPAVDKMKAAMGLGLVRPIGNKRAKNVARGLPFS
jgi:hypothetical protein